MYQEEPPCDDCQPEQLTPENIEIYSVFCRLVLGLEQIDVFKLMDLVGIGDKLKCIDLIAYVISELKKEKG